MTSSIVLTAIIDFILLLVYSLVNAEKKKQTNELKSVLVGLENFKGQNQNINLIKTDNEFVAERGTLNTILRIILYPFSIICIVVSIFYFFSNDKIRAGIWGVLIPLVYLITDIKILKKSRKRKNR